MVQTFRVVLLAGGAVLALGAAAARSFAATVPFELTQTAGTPNYYTLTNNTSDQYVYDFVVTDPQAVYLGASTTQRNWSVYFPGACFSSECYWYKNNDNSNDPNYAVDDVGPHSSNSNFFFITPLDSSYLRYEIFYVNPTNAATGSYTVTYAIVPEPSTWAMMLLGFAGLGFAGCQSERGAMRRLCAIAEKA